jgi:hypothetical protein
MTGLALVQLKVSVNETWLDSWTSASPRRRAARQTRR